MKRITKYHKRVKITFVFAALASCFLIMLFFNVGISKPGTVDYYVVKVGGQVVGTTNNGAKAEQALADARTKISSEANSIVYANTDLELEKEDHYYAETDSQEELTDSIYELLESQVNLDYSEGYMIVSGEYSIIVDSVDSVATVLETLESSYDSDSKYSICLDSINDGNFTGITYDISKSEDETTNLALTDEDESSLETSEVALAETENTESTAASQIENEVETVMAAEDETASNSDTANLEVVGFSEDLEIKPVYVDSSEILTADEAISQLNEEGAEAIGVVTVEVANYDESYYAEVQTVKDDSLYEGQSVTVQEAVAGVRNVTARISYVNGWESSREIIDEQIITEAVPQIIHEGTQVAPTFVVPVNGSLTSTFGPRWGTVHQGNDYGAEYASPEWASCAGTVTYAGWNDGGYGFMVVIDHGNGLSTRYAHMCQVACTVGQYVQQYEVIGYAGSTGDSTGVHCHFEIMENGVPVDPFLYLTE